MDKIEPWIQTYSGKKFWLDPPMLDQIDIIDIAHALSMTCRYGGHSKFFYSVAQHCCLMTRLVPKRLALAALLHDASEAYLGDVVKPLKELLGMSYSNLENTLESKINLNFSIVLSQNDVNDLKMADLQMLKLEALCVFENPPIENWHHDLPDQKNLSWIRNGWTPKKAEREFLNKFAELTRG